MAVVGALRTPLGPGPTADAAAVRVSVGEGGVLGAAGVDGVLVVVEEVVA